jgi:hypothetical protein
MSEPEKVDGIWRLKFLATLFVTVVFAAILILDLVSSEGSSITIAMLAVFVGISLMSTIFYLFQWRGWNTDRL